MVHSLIKRYKQHYFSQPLFVYRLLVVDSVLFISLLITGPYKDVHSYMFILHVHNGTVDCCFITKYCSVVITLLTDLLYTNN